jgi:hypothetical protein
MLSGDAAALRKNFSVTMTGNEDQWVLELTPVDAKARRRLKEIEIAGRASEPRCFSMLTADGASSVLLLGAAAGEELPKELTLAALLARCNAAPHTTDSSPP